MRKNYHHGNRLPWEVRVLNGDVRNDTTRTALNRGLPASVPYANSETYAVSYNSAGGVQHTDPHISAFFPLGPLTPLHKTRPTEETTSVHGRTHLSALLGTSRGLSCDFFVHLGQRF